MRPFQILVGNGVVPSIDPDGNVVFSVAGTVPAPAPTPPPAPTPTPVPNNPLDLVYFTEADLLVDCLARGVVSRVTVNNNGNVRTIRPGAEPPIPFDVTATGTLRMAVVIVPAPAPTPAPTPTPAPPAPTPPGPPPVIVNGRTITVQWPTSGQKRTDVREIGNATHKMVIHVPAPVVLKPNNTGFIRFTEYPGSPFQARQVAVFVNGELRFDTGENGNTSPGIDWCLGNPARYAAVGGQFNAQPGDLIEIVHRAYNAGPAQDSSYLFDFATPLRY